MENTIKLNERALRRIVSESVRRVLKEGTDEILNTAYRPGTSDDGRYRYQGTGSPESAERVRKMRSKAAGSHNDDFFATRNGKMDSPYKKSRKEYGKLENTPSVEHTGYKDNWEYFIDLLRDFASKNGYRSHSPRYIDDYAETLKTKEGAASFIKYLYKNGFKSDFI